MFHKLLNGDEVLIKNLCVYIQPTFLMKDGIAITRVFSGRSIFKKIFFFYLIYMFLKQGKPVIDDFEKKTLALNDKYIFIF